jgi:hypothetical protein
VKSGRHFIDELKHLHFHFCVRGDGHDKIKGTSATLHSVAVYGFIHKDLSFAGL